jgi:hypothetical protein
MTAFSPIFRFVLIPVEKESEVPTVKVYGVNE